MGETLKVLDLFSGIGGFSLGLRMAGGFETVQFVEIEPFCQKVLAKNFPGVPIHDDIRSFRPARGSADLVCGGFPCQPFSVAGKQAGTADDRDLWPEMRRVIEAVRPAWVVGENVAGFVNMELDRSLSDLEALGYACQALVIPACATDAPHRRDRVWIVGHALRDGREPGDGRGSLPDFNGVGASSPAGREDEQQGVGGTSVVPHSTSKGLQGQQWEKSEGRGVRPPNGGQVVADADHSGRQQQRGAESERAEQSAPECHCRWLPEPPVGRVAHGIPRRVDRLRGLGNAVVPQIVAEIGKAIRSAA